MWEWDGIYETRRDCARCDWRGPFFSRVTRTLFEIYHEAIVANPNRRDSAVCSPVPGELMGFDSNGFANKITFYQFATSISRKTLEEVTRHRNTDITDTIRILKRLFERLLFF